MVAATDATVLIIGETGTGKEVLASALKQYSRRSDQPLVTINCAALPESLAESELFGHRKGSFTGASDHKIGRLQAAHNGTVFLDEIDSLPVPIQAKFLRFLETGEIQPVGETKSHTVDVRLIAATNANLQERIESGDFRRDLYYRLNVVPLEIPPLRDRSDDIPALLQLFIQRFSQSHSIVPPRLSKAALQRLLHYGWPGNVRELRNVCERLCILMAGQEVQDFNLPVEIISGVQANTTDFSLPEGGIQLEGVEADLIRQALQRAGGNRSKAARLLGITRDTLLYRIQKYGLDEVS
jgi:transcriptional regulator with PAS, ATPase and Fis domain